MRYRTFPLGSTTDAPQATRPLSASRSAVFAHVRLHRQLTAGDCLGRRRALVRDNYFLITR